MRKKVSDKTILEDGSAASTGHATKKSKTKEIISVSSGLRNQIETDKKIEYYAYKIRQEAKKLSALTEEISSAYSQYAESNERIDSAQTIHNGLGNMMKLIEVQTTTKLRIKKMQTSIMQAVAMNTPDDELPYAIQDIMRDVNVNFLDSKLVRAYGEIARIMKEDLELAKINNKEIKFTNGRLTSELEAMPSPDTIDIKEDEEGNENENENLEEFEEADYET